MSAPEFAVGSKVVVDGTLIVEIVNHVLISDSYVVETGHGSMLIAAERIVALA